MFELYISNYQPLYNIVKETCSSLDIKIDNNNYYFNFYGKCSGYTFIPGSSKKL